MLILIYWASAYKTTVNTDSDTLLRVHAGFQSIIYGRFSPFDEVIEAVR